MSSYFAWLDKPVATWWAIIAMGWGAFYGTWLQAEYTTDLSPARTALFLAPVLIIGVVLVLLAPAARRLSENQADSEHWKEMHGYQPKTCRLCAALPSAPEGVQDRRNDP